MDVLLHADLPGDMVQEILARCDAASLACLARLDRAWAARVRPALDARLTHGVRYMPVTQTLRSMVWCGQHTRGLIMGDAMLPLLLESAGHVRHADGERVRYPTSELSDAALHALAVRARLFDDMLGPLDGYATLRHLHDCTLDAIVQPERGVCVKVDTSPWAQSPKVMRDYASHLRRAHPRGALLACDGPRQQGLVFVHDYAGFMDECRRVRAYVTRLAQ